ncbi:MAG: class I SAM-dependent methyltransferase [Proteobacteria bacterium]|nr:class I SAM-dependent methyltransferase [Pseudomonadota bacterium]MBU1582111.1 class I SAM-dependent methyltransferase [Pseudomonadota bacterium]MBU2453217.1 class I SAM-dependent methyltransferase [Pseudomonadota bacterium]
MIDKAEQAKGIYSLRSKGIAYRNLEIFYHYRSVKEILPSGKGMCLDLGARDSNFKQFIIDQGYDYVGIDINAHPSLDIVGDGCMLPFDENSFDCVVLAQVLEHVFDPQKTVSEVSRVLKPGGVMVGGVSFLEPYHKSYFNISHRAIEDIISKTGLNNICIEAGVTGVVLIMGRILGMFGSNNLTLFSTVTRLIFPIKYILKLGYFMMRVKNRIKRRDSDEFEKNIKDHYESISLSIAGHILFYAKK